MDLVLASSDIVQVGSCSFRNTLTLLPLGKKKKRQKLVVGDDNGNLNCFEMKSGDIVSAWSLQPNEGKEIARLELGGDAGAKEKIFVSSGQQIFGITKKGKQFFNLHTNLSEVITTMFVNDTKIYTGGEYIYNIFDDGKDVGFYMSSDRINDLCCALITRDDAYDTVIGSQNKKLQVLQEANPILEIILEGAVNEIHVNTGRKSSDKGAELIYGTVNGMVGSVNARASGMRPTWLLPAEKKGKVNCIQTFDLTNDGIADILIGRDDGCVQVYSFDMGEEPELLFTDDLGGSIRSIDVGVVKTPEYTEVVMATYSGRIMSLSSQPVGSTSVVDAYGRSNETLERESQIVQLRKELDKLRNKVAKEKEAVMQVSNHDHTIPVHQSFKVNSQFSLSPDEAGYIVSVEIPYAIDTVTLQSSIPIEILDADNTEAIITRSDDNGAYGNRLLATCRYPEGANNRLEFKVRTIEGQYGELQAIIIAKMQPKTARSVKFLIKPLSLHHRLNSSYVIDRPVNTLKITGSFTIGQIHEWVCRCLPDVPPRATTNEIIMNFKNSFLGSVLSCSYKRGEGIFKSDSVSTIAIIKEVITKEATSRKMTINTTFDIVEEALEGTLKLLRPKLDYQLTLARKIELIDALKEIQLAGANNEASFLDEEYLDIVTNAEKYRKAFKNRPRSLEILYGIVQDLYVDKFKFRGLDVRSRLPELNTVLANYSFDKLLAFFQNNK